MTTAAKKERISEAARKIVENIIDLEMTLHGNLTMAALRIIRNIQIQARALITGGEPTALPHGDIGHGYRRDMLEVLQGLADHLCSKAADDGRVAEDLSDEALHVIALAAGVVQERINNYLLVVKAEKLLLARQGAGQSAALPEIEAKEA